MEGYKNPYLVVFTEELLRRWVAILLIMAEYGIRTEEAFSGRILAIDLRKYMSMQVF